MKLRTVSRWSVLAVVVAVGLFIAVRSYLDGQKQTPLQGTDLLGVSAPDFTLVDQSGQQVSLKQFRGRPVVLAFMFTHCTDICPLNAEKMHGAATNLGKAADKVAWVAVSVDPTNDTPDSAAKFAADHGLTGKLRFLMGSEDQLVPVWRAYHLIDANAPPPTNPTIHYGGVYVIDSEGRERVLMSDNFSPSQLADNLKLLGAE
ncbi:MAG TPA: SCO family protein [Ktedonobacterales bacterium]|jgi:protein SCO1/2